MFGDCKLIHPVHERMAFLDDALELTSDTGYQFFPSHQVTGIDGPLLCLEKVCLDPLFLEFNPIDQAALFKLLDNARTLPAVYTQLFPEFALEHTIWLRLDTPQCVFFSRIGHVLPP